MTEPTLREKVLDVLIGGEPAYEHHYMTAMDDLDAIAAILEDTGAPAHMRVAAELRGNASDFTPEYSKEFC